MARFQREFPDAARRLEERFAHVKGSCLLQTQGKGKRESDTRPSTIDEADFAIDHGNEKLTLRRMPSPTGKGPHSPLVEFVYCVSKNSDFSLVRPPGAAAYTVEEVGTRAMQGSAYTQFFGRFVRAHQGVMMQTMSQVMSGPGFLLKDAERVTEDGRSLVKIHYEAGREEPKNQGSVVLDPDGGWVVRSSEFRPGAAPKMRFTANVTYEPTGADGILLPRRVIIRGPTDESSCEYTNWSFEPTPIAEFGMPFYGLPDLTARVEKRWSTLPYWLAGLAVAGVGLAFVLKRLSR